MLAKKVLTTKWLVAIPVALVVLYAVLVGSKYSAFGFNRTGGSGGAVSQEPDTLVAGSPEKFAYLSNQRSST